MEKEKVDKISMRLTMPFDENFSGVGYSRRKCSPGRFRSPIKYVLSDTTASNFYGY